MLGIGSGNAVVVIMDILYDFQAKVPTARLCRMTLLFGLKTGLSYLEGEMPYVLLKILLIIMLTPNFHNTEKK